MKIETKLKKHAEKFKQHKEEGLELAKEPGNGIGYAILFNGSRKLITDKKLSVNARLFYFYLISVGNQESGFMFFSNEKLAKAFHISVRQVQRYFKELENRGYIERINQKNGFSFTLIKPLPHK